MGDKLTPEEEQEIKNKIEENSKQQNKIIVGFFIFVGVVAIVITAWIFISYMGSHVSYRGIEFDVVDEIAPYRITLPINAGGGITGSVVKENDFYFYLRNDPRDLEAIEFDADIVFLKDMVLSMPDSLHCEGDSIISIANLARLYQVLGTIVIKDENAGCDDQGRYVFLEIQEGEETKITQTGPSCYLISVNNCEILPATEKFMVESFIEVKKIVP